VSTDTNQSDEQGKLRKRRTAAWLLAGVVVLMLAIIAAQQLFNLGPVLPPETGSDTLLLYALSSLNFAAFMVFSFILLRSLLRLRRERRERQPGSRIQTRLLIYFVGLSLLPITAMAAFSYLFLNRSIEKWMGRLPESVVERVREQQRESLTFQFEKLRETATLVATGLKTRPQSEWQAALDQLAATGKLSAIEIVSDSGQLVAHSEAVVSPAQQTELKSILERGRQPEQLNADATLSDGKGYDLTSVPLTAGLRLILVPQRLSDTDVNDTIAGSQRQYQHLLERQRKVRLLGVSTLGLMTLLLLFASTWVAIHLSRGFAAPIRSLVRASKEVARGNLGHRVDTIADEELALLAESFNQMTAELDTNRKQLEAAATVLKEKNLALEERRDYIETVLESLGTGVVSVDQNDCVTTINTAAISILKLSEAPPLWASLLSVLSNEDRAVVERLLRRARRAGRAAEQNQLTRGTTANPTPVALTATALRGSSNEGRRVVIVIEDLSELLTAQRAAAWSEVARRIAHEIKNPLTPIQLSAERIARNFAVSVRSRNGLPLSLGEERGEGAKHSDGIDHAALISNGDRASSNGDHASENGNGADINGNHEELARVVEECTTSITREVAGLKALVDEFARFARMPPPKLELNDLNEVIRQTALLYDDRLGGIEMRLQLEPQLPLAMLDVEQIKRVFVNLIDNALEGLADVEGERCLKIISKHDAARELLVAAVEDTGEGIPAGEFKRLFQPYFSTRGRGTGLGLAIVSRIISEHDGKVYAEANSPTGARFVIELPVLTV
jgi:two-component system nitrogen regulation sensor histidine kinase NtrY